VTGFLSELGSKLADRWLSLLVLPGLLFLTAIGAAALLGQHQALDVLAVEHMISAVSASAAAHSTGAIVLIAAGALAASATAGLAGTLAGRCIELLWAMPGRRWPARLLTAWRTGRWERAQARELDSIREFALAVHPPSGPQPPGAPAQHVMRLSPQARLAIAKRERIGLIRPTRPTWIGDRLQAADQRVYTAYGLDLASAWPALWLIIPDSAHSELGSAQAAYSAAARLTGWGILYGLVGLWWWPALVIAAVTAGTGWLRGRSTADVLARLVEAAVDLYGYGLGRQLGVPGLSEPAGQGRLDGAMGAGITDRLRKDLHVTGSSTPTGVL
jgi:hypothetical protein